MINVLTLSRLQVCFEVICVNLQISFPFDCVLDWKSDERKGPRLYPRYEPVGTHDMKAVVDQMVAETNEGLGELAVNAGATA